MFKFPKELPLNLHLCPEADRGKWLAELDLDPNQSKTNLAKLAVCSLHFKEGAPTDKSPLPTELLSAEKSDSKFGDLESASDSEEDQEGFKLLWSKKTKLSKNQKVKRAIQARRKRRQWIPAMAASEDKKASKIRSKKFVHSALFGSKIQCRFCRTKFVGTKQYFRHVRRFHLRCISSKKPTLTVTDPTPPVKSTVIKKVN